MAGHAVSQYMFSGSGSGAAGAPAVAASGAAGAPGGAMICGTETHGFLQCMSETNNDFTRCDHIYDMFKQCHVKAGAN